MPLIPLYYQLISSLLPIGNVFLWRATRKEYLKVYGVDYGLIPYRIGAIFRALENQVQIRQLILERRRQMPIHAISTLSKAVVARFTGSSGMFNLNLKSLRVGFYCALPTELDLSSLATAFFQAGCHIHFPRVASKTAKNLEFVRILEGEQPDSLQWTRGSYGIQEPREDLPAINPEDLDLIFVPGVAFGEKGERIGMGAGYYDRFLLQNSKALRVALAFDFQVYSDLDQKPHDQSLHWIFTESREFKSEYVGQWSKKWRI